MFLLSSLDYKLRSGILLGIVGISAFVGTASSVVNSSDIADKVNQFISPVGSFFKDTVGPQLNTVVQGASSIHKIFVSWANSAFGKSSSVSQWLKNQKFSNISKGFNVLVTQFKSYADTLTKLAQQVWESRDVVKKLNLEVISKFLLQLSEFSKLIRTSLHLLWNTIFMAIQHLLSPDKNSQGSKSLEYIKKLIESGQLIDMVKAAATIATHNMENIKNLTGDELSQISKYAVENPKAFIDRVNSLKDTNTENKLGQWNNYDTTARMINDITQNTWSSLAYKFVNTFALGLTECKKEKKECNDNDALPDLISLIGGIFSSK